MKASGFVLTAIAALTSGRVNAIDASNYTNASEFEFALFQPGTENIRISGSNAQARAVLGYALTTCAPGTATRYGDDTNFVVFCTALEAGLTFVFPPHTLPYAGAVYRAIYYYSNGGSYYGLAPLASNVAADGSSWGASGNQLPFLDLKKLASACVVGGAATSTPATFDSALGAFGSFVSVSCGKSTTSTSTLATTYIGLSDVEPAFFVKAGSNITSDPIYATIYGIAATTTLRNALQASQGLMVGADDVGNMPSLSSAQLVSAFTQFGQTWAGIGVNASMVDNTVYVARRVDTAGTQKAVEALVVGAPNALGGRKSCSAFGNILVSPDSGRYLTGDSPDVCSGGVPAVVFSGMAERDVVACLVNHNKASRSAIGVLSMEQIQSDPNWRFLKIDGVAPTSESVARGAYRFYTTAWLSYRKSGAFQTVAAGGNYNFANLMKWEFNNYPLTTGNLADSMRQPFGLSGIMVPWNLLVSSQQPLDFSGATSVLPWMRWGEDSCQLPNAANF